MKSVAFKSVVLSLSLFLGASICGAQTTVTVGPTGQYASPCAAFPHLVDGETVQVDANGGVPYLSANCHITNNNLTFVGVNGRPVIQGPGIGAVDKGLWIVDGHDIVIDNFEFRDANGGEHDNGAGLRITDSSGLGNSSPPDGGNITVQHCYIHDNGDGIESANAGSQGTWFSANPFITFQYDEFAHNGGGQGDTHNMYMGFGGNLVFTLQYSWSHDSYIGHDVKTREPYNNILYNLISDVRGESSYMLNFPLGGSTYVVGNAIYKAAVTNPNSNENFMIWRDGSDTYAGEEGAYGPPNEDLHFINNTVIDGAATDSTFNFVSEECFETSTDACQPPGGGPALTVPAVIENNIFLGLDGQISNQPTAIVQNNITYANTAVTPASLAVLDFANPAALDFHILSGSPAIGAGIYPPTDNTGAADPKALAAFEYMPLASMVARPTPTGSTMDAGAYSYPPPVPPNLQLDYTQTIASPDTGTITVTGLPVPPAGQYNYAAFISGNTAAISSPISVTSSTGTLTATFHALPVLNTVVVPIYIYVDGTVLTANVTVNSGPAVPQSVTLDNGSYPQTTVTLNGPSGVPVVVQLVSSDPTVLWVPDSVTIPAGQISAETGSLNGSLMTPANQPGPLVTLSATAGGVTKTLTTRLVNPDVHSFDCIPSLPCPDVVGGQPYPMSFVMAGDSPYGGSTIYITSDTPAVIPNQSFFLPTGAQNPPNRQIVLSTNAVTTATPVHVTVDYNGHFATRGPINVTPPETTLTRVSGSGQNAAVGTNFPNPLVVLVKDPNNNPLSGATVTFAGTGVSFPSGATAVTDSNGQAQVTAQPTTAGSLIVTATVAGVSSSVGFPETGAGAPANVAVASGSGQTAASGTAFANPLVAVVKDAGGNPVPGTTVTFAGTGISFPAGATAVTNSSGDAQVTAQPTTSGPLTVTATVAGVSPPASFSETATAPPASIAAVSGSGQSAAVGTPFANPLVVLVKDANNNTVSGATVTFAGTGVSFPSGATTVTNSSGQAQVTAQPTSTGSLAITASVTGVSTPTSFSESATPEVLLASVTVDGSGPGTTVHLSTPATSPVVIQLSSSDPTVLFTPATVTIPTGATSAETGTLLGSVWTPPTAKTATLTATFKGVVKTASVTLTPPTIEFFKCSPASCKNVVGGNPYTFMLKVDGVAPVNGGVVQITSDNPAAFPNQTIPIPQGQTIPPPFKLELNTNAVTTTATVNVTATYGSVVTAGPISVTPPGVPSSIAVVSGSGQTVAVNTIAFANPLIVVVEDAQGNPVLPGTTVTFAGSGVTFPTGATATTDSAGHAQVTAQPTATGTLTVTASVSGVTTPASFSETGAPPPASVAVVSGSGQTAAAGIAFANPLLAVVKDASGNSVAGATVTFAGTGVTFPAGVTAVSNSSGQAQVTALPTTTGAITITAAVAGVGAPASFSETGTAGPPASIAAVSGSGQTAAAGTSFASPLIVIVKDAYSNLVPGATVTFTGTGVGFPAGATAVTNSSGQAQLTAQSATSGAITVMASVAGVSTPASFSETGTPGAPASVAVASGSGQSASLETNFANPLVVVVKDAYNDVVPGATVTFAGASVTFPLGATAVTDGSGLAMVTAGPTVTGALTVTATVTGVSTPANFAETATPAVHLASITSDGTFVPGTTVHLTTAATSPVVVTLTSSDPSIAYAPATVTVPTGAISAETGTLLGSLWGQSPSAKTATITATFKGITKTVTRSYYTPVYHSLSCTVTPCAVTGGQAIAFSLQIAAPGMPVGGGTIQIISNNQDVIPNQSVVIPQGGLQTPSGKVTITTNAVASSTPVNLTFSFNGSNPLRTVTVNP